MPREKIFRPRKRRWPLPRERWRGCGKPWRLLRGVLILTAALCLAGCGTTKKTEQAQSQQTVTIHDTVQALTRIIQTKPVPESRVEMSICVDSLLKLPEGATYHRKSGQARAEVSIRGDTIYVRGTCDSLAREVEYFERMYRSAQSQAETYRNALQTASESSSKTIADPWIILTTLLLPFIIVSAAAILIKKTNK